MHLSLPENRLPAALAGWILVREDDLTYLELGKIEKKGWELWGRERARRKAGGYFSKRTEGEKPFLLSLCCPRRTNLIQHSESTEPAAREVVRSMAKGEASDVTAATPATSTVVEELPKTIVRRVVKDKLFQLSSASSKKAKSGEVGDEEMMLHKDALIAFSESARIFIHYLSATANDICKESKRQTINAEDVFKALDDMEFTEFIQPLRDSLEAASASRVLRASHDGSSIARCFASFEAVEFKVIT
ncbi:hypothetical protein M5K25_008187 [Dendrobium thyrsiflorum]|uniref:Transcription factor CBF/NF-Y/archaeal histone domain-containing protein n=1 Tax=Dendrobium thyrsiflorum TaxID=117978 RepID=A0ABD0V955_DENTH